MEATVRPLGAPLAAEASPAAGVPWNVAAVLFASTCVVAGITWDISWHSTIGRDSFWNPAHVTEYVGGLVAGLSCGWVALRSTFARTPADRARLVRFWGFHGPLGGWICIWGTFAMLTSAPFDNWWHNAYGLDVQILSPPHTVLALGILAIQLGALVMALAWQNNATGHDARPAALLFAYALGIMLLMAAIMGTEHFFRSFMHTSDFYRSAALVFPVFLAAALRSSTLRWPATTVAAVYTLGRLLAVWILPLFPAAPRLGPIYQDITHMVPPDFPLLVIVPAIALDLVFRRAPPRRSDWINAVVLGLVFLGIFLAVQWPFADFLMSPSARNRFFATTNFPYFLPKTTRSYRYLFIALDPDRAAFLRGLGIAAIFAMLSTRLGLAWGAWMRTVRR